MQFKKVDIKELKFNPFSLIGDEWALLTSGPVEKYNTMTVSWGHMGVMWGSPSVCCFVRTNRHTLPFMEENDTFTLCFFDEKYNFLDLISFVCFNTSSFSKLRIATSSSV